MIGARPELSIRRQCELLQVSRSGLYYEPVGQDPETLALMKRIDEIHLKWPFYGSRKVSLELRTEGKAVNRKATQRLMRLMDLESIAPKPNTSKPSPEHPAYPYLLRNLEFDRPDQVWVADITYIPMAHGFAYLVAIIDWHSRYVLSWRLSNTLDTSFCLEALEEALERFGAPEIFNTDQGAQFTSDAFTGRLRAAGIKISMDGRGRCIDNIFVERLWLSLKYEEVFPRKKRPKAERSSSDKELSERQPELAASAGTGEPAPKGAAPPATDLQVHATSISVGMPGSDPFTS